MELNKIFAALLVAGIVAMGSALLADVLYAPTVPEQQAFLIAPIDEDGATDAGGAAVAAADEAVPSVLPLLAGGDPAAGQDLARACAACHTFDEGGPNLVGPNNWDIVGSTMGHIADFNYSDALAARHDAGDVWSYESLSAFLLSPQAYIPGTSMVYAGIADVQDRAHVIAWLRTLSNDPEPLPTEDEIAAVTGDAAEEAPVEEAPVEEPAAEDPTGEESGAEAPVAEDATVDTAVSETAAEDAMAEETAAETAAIAEDVVEAGGDAWNTPADLAQRLAAADPANGQAQAAICMACHTFDPGAPNTVGPNNWNIVGAAVGHVEGFNYTQGLQDRHAAGDVWTYESLDNYLRAPMEYVPGTSMVFAGVADDQSRADIIAWLRTLSDNPVPLP